MMTGFLKDNRGMTLVDISISLLVLTLIAVPLVRQYEIWRTQKEANDTIGAAQTLDNAIEDFFFINNRYPCPALPNQTALNAGAVPNPNYGVENCTGADDWDGTNDGVLVGEIPFATLKIPAADSLDAWKNRLTYAVTRTYADNIDGTGTQDDSLIDFTAPPLVNVTQIPMDIDLTTFELVCKKDVVNGVTPPDVLPVHYVIVSHGDAGVGAAGANGVDIQACPVGGLATAESENCDNDANFLHQQCTHNITSTSAYMDDIMSFVDITPSRLWPHSLVNEEDAVTTIPRVGIGEGSPIFPLDVVGNLKIDDGAASANGNIIAANLCTNELDGNNNPTKCFYPALLVGDEPSMDCNGQAIIKLAGNAVQCGGGSTVTQGTCPPGQYLKGYNASGDMVCEP